MNTGALGVGRDSNVFALESKKVTVAARDATALTVGIAGTTNPALQVDTNTASSATGVKITAAAAAGGVAVAAISSGTNEAMTINAKGSGTLSLQSVATGAISLGTNTTVTGNLTVTGTLTPSVVGPFPLQVTGTNAGALEVGQIVGTPAFIVSSAATGTGVSITAAAATSGVAIAARSSGGNENMSINAKGTGLLQLQSTALTGAVTVGDVTNPALRVTGSTVGNGISITSTASPGTVAVAAIGSGAENVTIDARTTGTLTLQGTALGAITLTRVTTCTNGIVMPSAGAVISGATVISATANAGQTFTVSQAAAYAITLPATNTMVGMRFTFVLIDSVANAVTISNGSAHLYGFLDVANVLTAVSGLTTITFVATGNVGNTVEVTGIDATHIAVKAWSVGAAKITIA